MSDAFAYFTLHGFKPRIKEIGAGGVFFVKHGRGWLEGDVNVPGVVAQKPVGRLRECVANLHEGAFRRRLLLLTTKKPLPTEPAGAFCF